MLVHRLRATTDACLSDFRYAARTLRRQPGFAITTVGVMALGIAANAAVFSVVRSVLLRPLPYREPQRLVFVWDNVPRLGLDRNLVSPANFIDWQQQNRVFESVDAYTVGFVNVIADDGTVERSQALDASPSFLETLGVRPVLGRAFRPDDANASGPRPVVLSDRLWRRRLGADPAVIGRTITLDRRPSEVIGVLPPEFLFSSADVELIRPSAFMENATRSVRGRRWLTVVARLAPGVSMAQAQVDMDAVTARLAEQYPDTNLGRGALVTSLADDAVARVRTPLWLLQGAVVLVLLIGAANVANLHLVRSLSRLGELATRVALGATRPRLGRQLFAEALLLALLGGAAGLLLAVWGTRLIVLLGPTDVPRLATARLDGTVLSFSLLATLSAALIGGVLPALRLTRVDLHAALKQEGRTAGRTSRVRLQRAFVTGQVALSLVLLAGAGVLARSFVYLHRVDPGFVENESVAIDLSRPHPDAQARAQFFEDLVARVRALPNVRTAGVTSHLPLSGEDGRRSFSIVGDSPAPASGKLDAEFRRVSAGYFSAMGIAVRRGRALTAADGGAALVNEAFVRGFLGGRDPLAAQLVIEDGPARARNIVGIVGDVRHARLDRAGTPEMYLLHTERPWPNMTLVVRSRAGDPARVVEGVRRELRALDPAVPLTNVKTMRQYVAGSIAPQRLNAQVIGAFAIAALLLAALGVHGLTAYTVSQRRHEIGIRMALGADGNTVIRMVLADALRLVRTGLLAGLVGAVVLGRLLTHVLYDVSPTDAVVLATVTALLAAVAVAASYLPARRAGRLDPALCMRQ